MIAATCKRIECFNELRNQKPSSQLYWDVVVITAADEAQKSAYEKQLGIKLTNKLLPLSADYIVVADPPNYKIGNGGSTLCVLNALRDKYGDSFVQKRTIIIHAGGYSQRLPNASVLGKVFLSVPNNQLHYQMLEVKLASYIDFPAKIEEGGVFVCCSDTFESYDDQDRDWKFPNTGFTGLAHPSPLEIGRTHGVYVLESSSQTSSLTQQCRKFLHKPSIELMKETKNCVHELATSDTTDEVVLTDSCYFISPESCHKLLSFYEKHKPLTCEVDAYGDFLQSLGTESNSGYITNTANVVCAANNLTATRAAVYEQLRDTPLHVVVLADLNNHAQAGVTSRFFHFGTTQEYLSLFGEEEELIKMLQLKPMSCSAGTLYLYSSDVSKNMNSHLSVLPYVMSSIVQSGASVGERSMVEFCVLRECVSIGTNCIVSHCVIGRNQIVPNSSFMHTVPVRVAEIGCEFESGYCTVVFSVNDDIKKRTQKAKAGSELVHLGFPLQQIYSNVDAAFSNLADNDVTLWSARLFPVYQTAEESSTAACSFLNDVASCHGDCLHRKLNNKVFLSMSDILRMKDLDTMLNYRQQLKLDINSMWKDQSCLPDHVK